jgi:hypothetical protein
MAFSVAIPLHCSGVEIENECMIDVYRRIRSDQLVSIGLTYCAVPSEENYHLKNCTKMILIIQRVLTLQ